MVSKIRAQRIADRIFQELSTLLIMEVSDPRLEGVSVTHVSVDRELAYANIYVSSLEGSEASAEILDGLNTRLGSCVEDWLTESRFGLSLGSDFIGIKFQSELIILIN